jgi:hypothetical protein
MRVILDESSLPCARRQFNAIMRRLEYLGCVRFIWTEHLHNENSWVEVGYIDGILYSVRDISNDQERSAATCWARIIGLLDTDVERTVWAVDDTHDTNSVNLGEGYWTVSACSPLCDVVSVLPVWDQRGICIVRPDGGCYPATTTNGEIPADREGN